MKPPLWLHGLTAALLAAQPPSQGQTLADFGHGSMQVNGQPAAGARPLLIIRADIKGDDNTTHPASYYDTLVFNWLTFPSVNGYMLENSAGRFSLSRAGTGMTDLINGVDFTAAERADLGQDVKRAGHCINAASRAGFNFAEADLNRDGTVTQDELVVLIVENNSTSDSGAARYANPDGQSGSFAIQNSTVRFRSNVCLVTQNVSFATLVHELSHLLGLVDLYGAWNQECLSNYLTLASCTITTADNPDTYHMDPWHKLRLGWCEPRIRDMYWGGLETIPKSQTTHADRHVILYDSARGPGEYFMLEYRSRDASPLVGYDDDARASGLVVWHIQQDAAHAPVVVPSPYIIDVDPATPGNQQGTHFAVWAETPPDLKRGGGIQGIALGGNGAWLSGSTTPKLRWIDGSDCPSHLFVRPFADDAATISVEIRSDRDTWVDFSYFALPELGTWGNPYNTFMEGLGRSSWGGTLLFKSPGSQSTGFLIISKRVTLQATAGPVILGR